MAVTARRPDNRRPVEPDGPGGRRLGRPPRAGTWSPRASGSGPPPPDAFAAADFFAGAFDPDPRLLEACDDPPRHGFLRQLLDTPEYRALHAATRLDDTAAGSPPPTSPSSSPNYKKEDAAQRRRRPTTAEMATLRAVGRAVAEAGEGGGRTPGRPPPPAGWGRGRPAATTRGGRRAVPAGAGRPGPPPDLRAGRPVPAGRPDQAAAEGRPRAGRRGRGRAGGDVGRLLPAELARLVVPELELDALRRIAERQAMCREHHAAEPVGKGPVIVCVDESGSMEGEKDHTAKALALALAWVARHQRRWCALVAYSGDTGERLLPLPPGRWDEPPCSTGSPRSSAAVGHRRAGPGAARVLRPARRPRRG